MKVYGHEENRIFIICSICGADTHHSLMLGKRRSGAYGRQPSQRELEEWFDQHAQCGGTRDHFKLALAKPADWDMAETITADSNVKAAVKRALVQ